MKNKVPLALAVFFSLFALLMLFDLWTLVQHGYESTVSATLYDFMKQFPIVGILFGILIGHLAWPNLHATRKDEPK